VSQPSSDLNVSAYDEGVEAGPWSDVVAGLQASVACQAALVVSYNFRRKSGHIRHAAGISPEFLKGYERIAPLDPWLSREAAPSNLKSPCIGKMSNVGSRLFDNRFHLEWLEPQGLYHCMYVTLANDGEVGEVCLLLRTKDAGFYDADDVAVFDGVLPELRKAWSIHKFVTALNAKYEAMLGIVDRFPFGVILVGRGCEVHETNESARKILSLNDGVKIDRGVLKTASHSETQHLHSLAALALDPQQWANFTGDDVVALSRRSGLPAFSALVSPLNASQNVSGEPFAAIFLSEENHQNDIDPRRLQKLYLLTRAEARLASLLAQGLNMDDAAAYLEVNINTARTQRQRAHVILGLEVVQLGHFAAQVGRFV